MSQHPPAVSDQPVLKLFMDGVSSVVIDKLDLAVTSQVPIGLIERIYVSDDASTPAILPVAKTIASGLLDPLLGGGTRDLVVAVVLILTIMIRPHGLFGRHDIERL